MSHERPACVEELWTSEGARRSSGVSQRNVLVIAVAAAASTLVGDHLDNPGGNFAIFVKPPPIVPYGSSKPILKGGNRVLSGLDPGDRLPRREVHARFGGRRQGGISPSREAPVIMFFADPRTGLVEAKTRTILVPSCPRPDLFAYTRSVGIDVVYPDGDGWARK